MKTVDGSDAEVIEASWDVIYSVPVVVDNLDVPSS
jgi:hypothetical protein